MSQQAWSSLGLSSLAQVGQVQISSVARKLVCRYGAARITPQVRDIEPLDITAWLGSRKRKDGRPGELAGGTKWLVFDLIARGKKPKSGKLAARILTPAEQEALMAAAKPWLRPSRRASVGLTLPFQTQHGGKHLHPRTVMDGFAAARRKALSDQPRTLRFHDLRHPAPHGS